MFELWRRKRDAFCWCVINVSSDLQKSLRLMAQQEKIKEVIKKVRCLTSDVALDPVKQTKPVLNTEYNACTEKKTIDCGTVIVSS